MRHAQVAVAVGLLGFASTAVAGPVLRIGAVGGYDASAPNQKEDGLAAGVGYRMGPWTAEADYSYLDYDGTNGVGGGAHRAGVLVQRAIYQAPCEEGACPHVDLDLGVGYRWVDWTFDKSGLGTVAAPISFSGREFEVGLSANFLVHLALHYVVFEHASDAMDTACRSTKGCSGSANLPSIGNVGVLLEASFALGGQ